VLTLERSRPIDQEELLDASKTLQTSLAAARKRNRLLQRKLDAMMPSGPYIVVDAIGNRLLLKDGEEVIREAICSTGSRIELKVTGPKERRWFFDTPRGVFTVLSRHDNPIWIKPDWAFVEEGKPIPPARSQERLEEGVLGAHSLNFGNGYMIHGTLYTIKLGQPVTHGCIRLGDEDLELVYSATKVGTPIYIY
jgi:L,D-transpeptidase YbiS